MGVLGVVHQGRAEVSVACVCVGGAVKHGSAEEWRVGVLVVQCKMGVVTSVEKQIGR